MKNARALKEQGLCGTIELDSDTLQKESRKEAGRDGRKPKDQSISGHFCDQLSGPARCTEKDESGGK